jgi:hypothetical protein
MAYERKAFYCTTCGKILGEVFRDSSHITGVMIYREPRNREEGLDIRPILDHKKYSGNLIVGSIICTCGCERKFYANQSTINQLAKRFE